MDESSRYRLIPFNNQTTFTGTFSFSKQIAYVLGTDLALQIGSRESWRNVLVFDHSFKEYKSLFILKIAFVVMMFLSESLLTEQQA